MFGPPRVFLQILCRWLENEKTHPAEIDVTPYAAITYDTILMTQTVH